MKHPRLHHMLLAASVLVALAATAMAGAVADSVAFQGSMTDAADHPIDGTRDMVFSLWTDSSGGTQLWSEAQTVTMQKGLFSTCLGCGSTSFFDVFTDVDLWLQMQVGGEAPMSPRTRMRNTPRALASSRVLGDVSTAPGLMVVGDSMTGPFARVHAGLQQAGSALAQGAARVSQDCDDNSASIAIDEPGVHFGITAHLDSSVFEQSVDPASNRVMIHKLHRGESIRLMQAVYPDSTVFDEGGDFGTANVIHRDLAARNVLLSESRFTGLSNTATIKEQCDDTGVTWSARNIGSSGQDGVEVSFPKKGGTKGGSHRMFHSTESGDSAMVESDVDQSRARLAIKTKGTSAKRLTAGGDCDDADASLYTDCDDDGDGVAETSVTQTSNSEGASLSINNINNGMPNRISMNVTVGKQTQSATFGSRCDVDGDGVAETQFEQRCSPDSVVSISETTDGSSRAISNMRTRINDLETKLQNIGLLRTTSSAHACDDTSATVLNAVDLDQDGLLDVVVSSSVSSSRSELKGHFQTGDIPTQEQFSTLLDSKGASHSLEVTSPDLWSSSTLDFCSPDSAIREVTITDPSGTYLMKAKEKANRTKCGSSLRVTNPSSSSGKDDDCDGISARSTWSNTSGGTTNSLTIEASSGIDPILHSSGARLTSGGVWTNASDENLKENFQPVDGTELLDKVESLPITEWNYKTESDEVKHIGPTAQDFQQVFGVGSDGKSISTIDPSGIALAAIKELSRQNKDLKERNAQLQKKLDDLSVRVDKLISQE